MNVVQTIGIPIAITLIAVALLWILIGVRGAWPAKLVLIVALPFMTFAVWSAMDGYLGWPTTDAMPKKALLVWADIREPHQNVGEPGAIFVWAIPLDDGYKKASSFLDYVSSNNEPRAYRMPYDRTLHGELVQAMGEVAKGGRFVIQGPNADARPSKEPEMCPVPGSGGDRRAQNRIYRLPTSHSPKYPNTR